MVRKTRRRMKGGMPRSKIALAVAIATLAGEEIKPVTGLSIRDLKEAYTWLGQPRSREELTTAAKIATGELGKVFSFETVSEAYEQTAVPTGAPLEVVPVGKLRTGESYVDSEGRTFIAEVVKNNQDGTMSIITESNGTMVVPIETTFTALPSTWVPIGGRKRHKTLRRKK